MGRGRKERKPLPPIWRASDELWAEVEPVLEELDPSKRFGPARTPPRPIFDAMLYRSRPGCQWNWLPKEYPDDSTVHRQFPRWPATLRASLPRFSSIAHLGRSCGRV